MHCPGLQAGDKKEHNNRGFSPTAVNGHKPGEIKNYLCPALKGRAIQKIQDKNLTSNNSYQSPMRHSILFFFLCHIELHCHSKIARLLCIALAFMHCPGLQAGDKKDYNNKGFSPTAVDRLKTRGCFSFFRAQLLYSQLHFLHHLSCVL